MEISSLGLYMAVTVANQKPKKASLKWQYFARLNITTYTMVYTNTQEYMEFNMLNGVNPGRGGKAGPLCTCAHVQQAHDKSRHLTQPGQVERRGFHQYMKTWISLNNLLTSF